MLHVYVLHIDLTVVHVPPNHRLENVILQVLVNLTRAT